MDLSQLLGGQQFSVSSHIGKNGYGVETDSLVDTGANGYAFINTKFAIQVARFCQTPAVRLQAVCYVKGYDGKTKEPVTHVIFLDLRIDGRQFKEVPLLIADLGNHEMILGRKWLAEQDIWLDVRNRRMIWPNGRSPEERMRLRNELVAPKGALDRPAPNPVHQKEMERRDRAIEAHDRKIQILKRNADESPRTPFRPPRNNYRTDQYAAMQKMDRALKGIEHNCPKKDTRLKPKPAKVLHNIDIACIGAEAFSRHLKNPSSEAFVTSLYEIDRAIDDKQVRDITDDAEMQALIDRVLPERYRNFRDVFSKKASDELSPHRPYDLKIELQGQVADHLGYSPLYKHTAEELEAAKQYIQDNLHKGLSHLVARHLHPLFYSRESMMAV